MEDNDEFYLLLEYISALEIEEGGYRNDGSFDEAADLIEAFRGAVMTLHRLTETKLDNLLIFHLTGKEMNSLGAKAQVNLKKKRNIFNRMEFYNKVRAVEDTGYIDGSLANRILSLNNIRNWFSHPAAYSEKIAQYQDLGKIVNDLNDIVDTYNEVGYV